MGIRVSVRSAFFLSLLFASVARSPSSCRDPRSRGDGVREEELIHAGANLRMQFEWDLAPLFERRPTITDAHVRVRTYRRSEEGPVTMFHALANEGDGELTPQDFESEGERGKGAVMPMPSLDEMPVGEEGTFTFDASSELREALSRELRILALQGRAGNEPAFRVATA